jgi:hypothetical protein
MSKVNIIERGIVIKKNKNTQIARTKLKGTHMEEKIFLQNNFLEIKMS